MRKAVSVHQGLVGKAWVAAMRSLAVKKRRKNGGVQKKEAAATDTKNSRILKKLLRAGYSRKKR